MPDDGPVGRAERCVLAAAAVMLAAVVLLAVFAGPPTPAPAVLCNDGQTSVPC